MWLQESELVQIALFTALVANGFGVFACGDMSPQFVYEGTAHIEHLGKRTAMLEGACHSFGKLSFDLGLHLHGVAPADLQRDAAANPRGTARPSHPVTLTWRSQSGYATLEAKDNFEMFTTTMQEQDGSTDIVLLIASVSETRNAADLFASIATEPGTLTWTQVEAGSTPQHIEASFAFSAADATALRSAALLCRQPPLLDEG